MKITIDISDLNIENIAAELNEQENLARKFEDLGINIYGEKETSTLKALLKKIRVETSRLQREGSKSHLKWMTDWQTGYSIGFRRACP